MKKLLAAALLVPSVSFAQLEKSPTEMYSIGKLDYFQVVVSVRTVNNKRINQECAEENKKNGLDPLPYKLNGCVIWQTENGVHKCTIVVGEKANNDVLGHELHHCIVGEFH